MNTVNDLDRALDQAYSGIEDMGEVRSQAQLYVTREEYPALIIVKRGGPSWFRLEGGVRVDAIADIWPFFDRTAGRPCGRRRFGREVRAILKAAGVVAKPSAFFPRCTVFDCV